VADNRLRGEPVNKIDNLEINSSALDQRNSGANRLVITALANATK
jgi:hypothetical protein